MADEEILSPVLASGATDEQAVIDVATRAAEPNVLDP